ncbi:MAG: hypothetical protein KJ697_00580 [Nanoarchaeota archaeon]|nr:hypothetical protein [Nanoarchaeota archaeon]MBU4123872.1 hypothetical protein [Nanoarchaeota archaeon]
MNRKQFAKFLSDKKGRYKQFGISESDINEFGEPIELIQAYRLYYGGNTGAYPQLYPSWARESAGGLKMEFSIDSLTEKKRKYEIPVLLKITDYSKEPFMVDFAERVRGKTKQDDINYLLDIESPGHQEIAARLWLENMLKRYTKIKKTGGDFKHVYDMSKKYVSSPLTPWYVTGSMDSVIMDEEKRMKKQRVPAIEKLDAVLEMLKDRHLSQ